MSRKFKLQALACKIMCTVFWDAADGLYATQGDDYMGIVC